MKHLYTLLIDPLGLPLEPIWEQLILLVVGWIVHEIAWNASPGGEFGSLIYWITKIAAYFAVWAAMYAMIIAIKFIIAHWVWFTVSIGGIAIVVVFLLVRRRKNQRNTG